MGAFIPGTLIVADSDAGRALLAQRMGGSTFLPTRVAPLVLPSPAAGAGGAALGPVAVFQTIADAFGLGNVNQVPVTAFQQAVKAAFPDPSTAVCGVPIDLTPITLNSTSLTLQIPCDDPSFGAGFNAGALDNLIVFYGLYQIMKLLAGFIHSAPAAPAEGGVSAGGSGPINITINQPLQIPANVLRAVSEGVNSGITAGTTAAGQIAQSTAKAITGSLDTFTTGLGGFVDSLGGSIGNTITNTLTSLFNPQSALEGAIAGDIGAVGGLVESLAQQIVGPLGTSLAGLEGAFAALPTSIEAILQSVFKSLPKIFVDLAAQLGGPLKDIVHWIEILTGHWPKVKSEIGGLGPLTDIMLGIQKAAQDIAGAATHTDSTVYKPPEFLKPGCGRDAANNWLQDLKNKIPELPCWVQDGLNGLSAAMTQVIELVPYIESYHTMAEENQNAECPLNKVPPSDLIQAWLRGLIDQTQMDSEMIVQGWTAQRSKLLRDVSMFLESPNIILDQMYRQVITPETAKALLVQNGFTDAKIQAAFDSTTRLTGIADGLLAWNRKIIRDDQRDFILGVNRLNAAQRDLYIALSRRPPTMEERLKGQLTRDSLGSAAFPFLTDFDAVPAWLTDAAHANGADDDTAQSLWWSHWQIGGIGNWISSYFRGLRSYPELLAVASADGVPETLLSDFIGNSRPLIPFRTIPGMMAAGILSESDARTILGHHGFESADIDRLIKYTKTSSKTTAAAAPKTNHLLSMQSAKQMYNEGVVTEDQYRAVLTAHGLDPLTVDNEVKLDQIQQAAAQRKAVGQSIVDEFKAGDITIDDAKQQLAQAGFTAAEQAKWQKQLKTVRLAAAKIPSEADLNHFLQKSIITSDEYVAALVASGYSSSWADHFLSFRVGGAANPPVPAGV